MRPAGVPSSSLVLRQRWTCHAPSPITAAQMRPVPTVARFIAT